MKKTHKSQNVDIDKSSDNSKRVELSASNDIFPIHHVRIPSCLWFLARLMIIFSFVCYIYNMDCYTGLTATPVRTSIPSVRPTALGLRIPPVRWCQWWQCSNDAVMLWCCGADADADADAYGLLGFRATCERPRMVAMVAQDLLVCKFQNFLLLVCKLKSFYSWFFNWYILLLVCKSKLNEICLEHFTQWAKEHLVKFVLWQDYCREKFRFHFLSHKMSAEHMKEHILKYVHLQSFHWRR